MTDGNLLQAGEPFTVARLAVGCGEAAAQRFEPRLRSHA
jgi:hypothetical protein